MIKILSQDVVNKIAAGEVVERPASVLKELIENSIDAGASEIQVYIEEFGTKKIQVIDNGKGIEKDDFVKVFLKHATSKISQISDLDSIHSYGFRGEALASISSVSRIVLQTKHEHDEIGSEIYYENGEIQSIKPSSRTKGTDIQVFDLFKNIPARKKFLKSKSTENKVLIDVFNKFALVNPKISFYLAVDGISRSFTASEPAERIAGILKFNAEDMIPLFYDGVIKISGFAVHPRVFLKNRSSQYIFVNNRTVQDSTIHKAIVDGFGTFLMKHQFPGYVIFLNLPPNQVDVNVHPRKTEVRFANPSEVYISVRTALNKNLTNFLKKETLKKLEYQEEHSNKSEKKVEATSDSINENNSQEETQLKSVEPSERVEKVSENSVSFETFLHGSDTPAKVNEVPVQPKTKYINDKALLFSEELVREDTNYQNHNGLNLDLSNATQLLSSYILTSNSNEILVIDQHAASERFFYEKYLKDLKNKEVSSKVLLFPEIVTLNEEDIKILEEHEALFREMGFRIEVFGSQEIKILEVPAFVKIGNFDTLFHRIITDVLENHEIANVHDKVLHDTAAILACHTAVRFGDKLEKSEIIQILKNLTTCEDPYNCPHGRPVIQTWTKYDIEKKFKRCGL